MTKPISDYTADELSENWSDVYCNRDVDVSKESLLQCIKEFVEQESES